MQSAGVALPPFVAEEGSAAPRELPTEDDGTNATPSPAIDGLLFLAVAQPTVDGKAMPSPLSVTILSSQAPSAVRMAVGDKRAAVDAITSIALPAVTVDKDAASLLSPAVTGAAAGRASSEQVSASQALALVSDEVVTARSSERVASQPTLDLPASPPNVSAIGTPQRAAVEVESPATASRAVESFASLSPVQGTTSVAPFSITVETPIHDASWRVDAAARIASLVTRGIEHAELRVSPPELGPVELRIDIRGGEATLAIVATQPTTRDALEQALPVLRDMLAQQGLSLGQATVADGRSEPQSGNGSAPFSRGDAFGSDLAIDDADGSRGSRPGTLRGLIDVFA